MLRCRTKQWLMPAWYFWARVSNQDGVAAGSAGVGSVSMLVASIEVGVGPLLDLVGVGPVELDLGHRGQRQGCPERGEESLDGGLPGVSRPVLDVSSDHAVAGQDDNHFGWLGHGDFLS